MSYIFHPHDDCLISLFCNEGVVSVRNLILTPECTIPEVYSSLVIPGSSRHFVIAATINNGMLNFEDTIATWPTYKIYQASHVRCGYISFKCERTVDVSFIVAGIIFS